MREKLKRVYDTVHAQRCVMQILIVTAAIAIDQIAKEIVTSMLAPWESVPVLGDIFKLTYIQNEGASFGILQGKRVFFIIATGITLVALGYYMVTQRKKQGNWLRVCLSLIAAGAAGNFIDRLTTVDGSKRGFVRDFLDFSGLHFPWIFNVADMCLVVGSIMLGIYILFIHKEKDGKPMFAKREHHDELLEGDEKLEDEDASGDTNDTEDVHEAHAPGDSAGPDGDGEANAETQKPTDGKHE